MPFLSSIRQDAGPLQPPAGKMPALLCQWSSPQIIFYN